MDVPGRGKETFRVRVATGKRHPVRSVCRNFGRVLRGWPWKCLEEGRETSLVKVATRNRCPVRSECRNFGRILRGWPLKCLEDGRGIPRMKVATGKRHPSDSRLHAKSRSRDRRRPGIREAHSQANTARPGAAGVLRGQSTPTI